MSYRKRRGALSRGEREWRVEEDALVTEGPSGRTRRYLWRDFAGVRLYCDPAKDRPWRFVFELQPKDRRRIVIDNAHFVSRGLYEDRSADYTPFVRAAVSRLASTKPGLRVLIGETPRRYFLLILAGLLALCGAAYAMIALRTPLDALPFAGVVKLAVMALLAAAFWRWVVGIVPRGVPADAIPERALPGFGACDRG
ncbi:MAG: hypothetical protein JNM59_07790 [Hyphomonadaceae bacterium]|nr:hypothetical protein [Hyphomonadaceae bacterium]